MKYRVDGQSCCFSVHTSMESCSFFIVQYIKQAPSCEKRA
jgi:hypothetical protein